MNKKYLYLPLAALALGAMTGCGKDDSTPAPTVTGLTVSGAKTEFKLEDEFTSEGLVVKANWSDGTQTDVTSSATVDSENFDNETVSDYEIVVSYEGQSKSYFVNVHPFLIDAVSLTLEKGESAIYGSEFNFEFPASWGDIEKGQWFSTLEIESDNPGCVDLYKAAFNSGYVWFDALSEGEAIVAFNCDMDGDGDVDDPTPVELGFEVGPKTKYNKFEKADIIDGLGLTEETVGQMPYFSFLGDFEYYGLQSGSIIFSFGDVPNSAEVWATVNETLEQESTVALTLMENAYTVYQFSIAAGDGSYWGLDITAAKFDPQAGSPTAAETGIVQLFISGDATDPYYLGLTGEDMNSVGTAITVHPVTTLNLPDLPEDPANRVYGPYPFENDLSKNNGLYFQVVPMQGSALGEADAFEAYVEAYLGAFVTKGYTKDTETTEAGLTIVTYKSSDSTHEVEIDYRLDDGHYLSQMAIYIGAYTADPVDFEFDDEDLTVSVGTGYQLTTSFKTDYPFVGSEDPTFSIVEGSSYAEITADGYLSAVAEGQVTVKAVSGTYEHTLTVTIADDLTKLQKAMLELYCKADFVGNGMQGTPRATTDVDVYSDEAELDLTASSYEDYVLIAYAAQGADAQAIANELIGMSSFVCPTGVTLDVAHAQLYATEYAIQVYAYAFDTAKDIMIEFSVVYTDLYSFTGVSADAGKKGLLIEWTLSETTDDVYYYDVADTSVAFTAGDTFNANDLTVAAVCFDGTVIPLTAGEDYSVLLCTVDGATGEFIKVEDQTAPLAEGTYYEVVVDGQGNLLDYIEITVTPAEE